MVEDFFSVLKRVWMEDLKWKTGSKINWERWSPEVFFVTVGVIIVSLENGVLHKSSRFTLSAKMFIKTGSEGHYDSKTRHWIKV